MMKNSTITKVHVNRDIFMVEILGMTNYCNLRCEYCDWEKYPYVPLTDEEKGNVQRNLDNSRLFIQKHFPEAQMIEYSGGEPFFYPEIVMNLLDVFPDYWVRVITNGTLVKEEHLDKMAAHGKVFMAISLDGATVSANHSRRLTKNQLGKVFNTIDGALKRGISVMLLCTLNEDNTDDFIPYIDFLYQKWGKYIDSGLLVLPAHILTSYSVKHRASSVEQKEKFRVAIQNSSNPIILKIKDHYDDLFNTDVRQCTIYRWTTSMHFIGNEIATDGNFTTFRCGMRGIGKVGVFNVGNELVHDTYSEAMENALKTNFASLKCSCTVDWNIIDKILAGVVDLEVGAAWFKLFQDTKIQDWILSHKDHFQIAYTRGGNLKKPILRRRSK